MLTYVGSFLMTFGLHRDVELRTGVHFRESWTERHRDSIDWMMPQLAPNQAPPLAGPLTRRGDGRVG